MTSSRLFVMFTEWAEAAMPKMGGRQRWFSRVEARLLLLRSGSLLVLIVLENRANVLARSEQLRRLVLLPAARDDCECPEVVVSVGSLGRRVARHGHECPKVIAPYGSLPFALLSGASRSRKPEGESCRSARWHGLWHDTVANARR